MKKIICLIVALAAVGCGTKPITPTLGVVTEDAVHDDTNLRSFIKVWHYQVTPEVRMNVTSTLNPWLSKCTRLSCNRFALGFYDELKQRDDKWVGFDCDAVADKIIDRDLVPKVQIACGAIHSIATTYWQTNNDPSEFTDHDGRVWKRL